MKKSGFNSDLTTYSHATPRFFVKALKSNTKSISLFFSSERKNDSHVHSRALAHTTARIFWTEKSLALQPFEKWFIMFLYLWTYPPFATCFPLIQFCKQFSRVFLQWSFFCFLSFFFSFTLVYSVFVCLWMCWYGHWLLRFVFRHFMAQRVLIQIVISDWCISEICAISKGNRVNPKDVAP